jgi:hypothetical protein
LMLSRLLLIATSPLFSSCRTPQYKWGSILARTLGLAHHMGPIDPVGF